MHSDWLGAMKLSLEQIKYHHDIVYFYKRVSISLWAPADSYMSIYIWDMPEIMLFENLNGCIITI